MRKKLFSVFITLCMIFTMLPVNVFAAGETMQIEVKTDRTGPLKTGDTVTMTLNIKAPVGLSGIQATVTSDNDNLKIAEKTDVSNTLPTGTYVSVAPSLADAKICSVIGTYATGLDVALDGDYVVAKYTATADIDVPVKFTFSAVKVVFGVAGGATTVTPTGKLEAMVDVALTGDLPVAITAPVKGGTPETTITGTNYTGSITWTPTDTGGKFAANTVYTANVTLTAKEGYQFAENVNPTVAGATGVTSVNVKNSGKTLEFKAAFAKTGTATLNGIDIITNPAL